MLDVVNPLAKTDKKTEANWIKNLNEKSFPQKAKTKNLACRPTLDYQIQNPTQLRNILRLTNVLL